MLPKLQRIKGKLDLVLNIRERKRELEKEAIDFSNLQPLVTFKEGKQVITIEGGDDQPDVEDLRGNEQFMDDELDDSLDDELEDDPERNLEIFDNMLVQEEFENEGEMDEESDSDESS